MDEIRQFVELGIAVMIFIMATAGVAGVFIIIRLVIKWEKEND